MMLFSTRQTTNRQEPFNTIANLLRDAPIRPHIAKPDKAPVWIPGNESGYFVDLCRVPALFPHLNKYVSHKAQ